ncbi:hypothetical protein CB1_000218012 [Camelus ferus]|nr:hypothetical protein CB1_000218012 [Camelus ferus]
MWAAPVPAEHLPRGSFPSERVGSQLVIAFLPIVGCVLVLRSGHDGSYLAEFLLEKGYEVSAPEPPQAGGTVDTAASLPLLPSCCVCFPPDADNKSQSGEEGASGLVTAPAHCAVYLRPSAGGFPCP